MSDSIPLFGVNSLNRLGQLATMSSRKDDYRKVIVKTALDLGTISLDDSRSKEIHDWKWVLELLQGYVDERHDGPAIMYAANVAIDTGSYKEINLLDWEKPDADVDDRS